MSCAIMLWTTLDRNKILASLCAASRVSLLISQTFIRRKAKMQVVSWLGNSRKNRGELVRVESGNVYKKLLKFLISGRIRGWSPPQVQKLQQEKNPLNLSFLGSYPIIHTERITTNICIVKLRVIRVHQLIIQTRVLNFQASQLVCRQWLLFLVFW